MQNNTVDPETYLKTFDLTHFFIKFIDAQFADDFIKNGELHFEPFVNFTKIDDGESGDPNEGSVALYVKKAKLISVDTNDQHQILVEANMDEEGVLQYSNENLQHFGLTSMFYVHQLNGLEVELLNSENYSDENIEQFEKDTKIAKINERVLDKFRPFLESENNKNKIPFLIFAKKFVERLEEKNFVLPRKAVTYYDKHDIDFFEKMRNGNILETLFVKTNEYSHQQEYRFVLPEQIPDTGKNIVMGNLEGVAIKLDLEKLYQLRAFLNV